MGQMNMSLYLKNLKLRYFQTNRKGKTLILDEFCATTGLTRKHAISVFNGPPLARKDSPMPRRKYYDPNLLLPPLKAIWLATDQMCSKRLKAALPLWLPHYEKSHELSVQVKQMLISISDRTIDRILKPVKKLYQKPFCGTKPGSLLKKHIPIKTDQWNETLPGFVEADTVAHCGSSLLGNFVWSITLTDIYSGWTENAAVWNKGAYGVLKQLEIIEEKLPFELLGFDSDNGSEFLNYHLIKHFQERKKPIQFTRSRPYHKGDNAHVEQKNWTHVRQLFGYYRFQNPELVTLMNDLYQNELSLLHNYFYPAMKLKNKVRIMARIIKEYHKPQTPYQRLMASEHVNSEQKEKMQQQFESLDPFELQQIIQKKLKNIFRHIDLKLKGRDTGT